jgi:hypothetical protein
MSRTIYVSGAITGVPSYRDHFTAAANRLDALGWLVVNPAELDLGPGATWQAYMKLCIPMLCPCDAIEMLPNWELSRGSREERRIAKMLGIPVQYADERSAVVFPKVEV